MPTKLTLNDVDNILGEKENNPTCPLCQSKNFKTEQARLGGGWGVFAHIVNLKICQQCNHVLMFYAGRGTNPILFWASR